MGRIFDTPGLFGIGHGASTCGYVKCGFCGGEHNLFLKGKDNENAEGTSVGWTDFAGCVIADCCWEAIEKEILEQMPQILVWYAKVIKRNRDKVKHLDGLIDRVIEALGRDEPKIKVEVRPIVNVKKEIEELIAKTAKSRPESCDSCAVKSRPLVNEHGKSEIPCEECPNFKSMEPAIGIKFPVPWPPDCASCAMKASHDRMGVAISGMECKGCPNFKFDNDYDDKFKHVIDGYWVKQNRMGRFILVQSRENQNVAWTGSAWATVTEEGMPVATQVCNFETEVDAHQYVRALWMRKKELQPPFMYSSREIIPLLDRKKSR